MVGKLARVLRPAAISRIPRKPLLMEEIEVDPFKAWFGSRFYAHSSAIVMLLSENYQLRFLLQRNAFSLLRELIITGMVMVLVLDNFFFLNAYSLHFALTHGRPL